MSYRFLLTLFLVASSAFNGVTLADDCLRLTVTASDGYSNVRSKPRVESDNLVAALPTGTIVQEAGPNGRGDTAKGQRWRLVSSPVDGWIHDSQVSGMNCHGTRGIATDAGIAAITRLAAQARSGNRGAAASFLAMARGVDGSFAEVYLDEISNWAIADPSSLAALVTRQPEPIKQAASQLLEYGLEGASAKQRGRFKVEMALAAGEE